MPAPSPPRRVLRFAAFEVDVRAGEVRKHGIRIKLQDQPFRLLQILLENPGEVVTREELQRQIWPADTFVDFDRGLNNAVKRLREALGDSPDESRYVETVPKRGYRFIAELADRKERSVEAVAQPNLARQRILRRILSLATPLLLVPGIFMLGWARKNSPFVTKAALSPIRAVAVLPLKNASNEPGQEYVADNMTDALTSDLSRINALTVISRSTTQGYRGTSKAPSQVARELGVDALIEGSVERVGDHIRVSAEVVSASDNRNLWSRTFERATSDVLVLQAEVASAIAERLKNELTPEEKAAFERRPVVDPKAYEAYLKGDHYWAKFTEEDWKKSKQYFQQAIQIDPNYAQPYRALAGLLMTEREWYGIGGDNLDDVTVLLNKSIALDPLTADGHIDLGWIHFHQWDLEGAEQEFRRAVALEPSHAHALLSLQHTLIVRGRMHDGVPQLERVKALDPASPQVLVFIALTEFLLREYDRGLMFCRESVEIEPDFAFGHYCAGKMLLAQGKPEAALAEFRTANDKGGEALPYVSGLGQAQAAAGAREAAAESSKQLEKNPSSQKHYYIALVEAALGNKKRALDALENAYTRHSKDLIYMESEPALDSLRGDPRFVALAGRVRPAELAVAKGQPEHNKGVSVPALEAYLQGQYHLQQAEDMAFRKGVLPSQLKELETARAFFEKAVQGDATYAQAYVGLARTWRDQPVTDNGPAKAESFLRKAIALDPELAEAHEQLATLDVLRLWRWSEAEQEYRRAIELNPNFSEARARYAEYLDCMKRFDEGMNEFLRTQQLDPGHSFQPNPFYRRRQYDRAIEVDQGEIQRKAFGIWSYINLAFDYDGAGKRAEGAKAWETVMRQLGYAELADAMRAGMQRSGYQGSIQALVAGMEAADARGEPPPSFFAAMMYGQLGEKDRAFWWLERGYRERSPAYSALNVDPCWDPLRDDPRFKNLAHRVGLP